MRTAPEGLYIAGPCGGQPYCKILPAAAAANEPSGFRLFVERCSSPVVREQPATATMIPYGYYNDYTQGYRTDTMEHFAAVGSRTTRANAGALGQSSRRRLKRLRAPLFAH
jgi:hypothetical protein